MRNRKQQKTRRNDTSEMTRRDQVAVSRLRTWYSKETDAEIINHEPPPECPFCYTKLITDYILWTCKETEPERIRMNITSEVWKGGKKEIEKLITYVKKNPTVQRYIKKIRDIRCMKHIGKRD
jgi:hypothetical protein